MPEQIIVCPECKTEIELTAALTETIRNSLLANVKAEAAKGKMELAKLKKTIFEKEKELSEREQSMDGVVEDRLRAERETLTTEAFLKAKNSFGAKAESLETELKEQSQKLIQAGEKELTLLKQQRKLEEAQQTVELEVERKLADASKRFQKEALEKAATAQELKLREKDDLVQSLRAQMADMQRSAEVGSQEAQGEALEGQLQDALEKAFPIDTFDEIKKGVRGADILQTVRNTGGAICGHILWESKNTKQFQKGWLAKLKEDQQSANADVAVLMSVALPEDIKDFAYSEEDSIWITRYLSAVPLCTALRHGLIQVVRENSISKHRGGYKDLVYDYITGQEFARHVRAIADTYAQMKEDLDSEKRSMNRIWSKREKQIAVVFNNVTGMYGNLEGLTGPDNSLPDIAPIMLDTIAAESD